MYSTKSLIFIAILIALFSFITVSCNMNTSAEEIETPEDPVDTPDDETTSIPVTGISLNETPRLLHPEDAITLSATVTPANATDKLYYYSSSNQNALTVDTDGNLTYVGNGRAVITVTSADGGFTDSCEIISCTPQAFISEWTVSEDFTLIWPFDMSVEMSNFSIDWGDGTTETVTDNDAQHIYVQAGEYTVVTEGIVLDFGLNASTTTASMRNAITDILQWGNVGLSEFGNQFKNCKNLSGFSAADLPDLSTITRLRSMFSGAELFNGDISDWDVSTITDMASMFSKASVFNCDISSWDTSNATTMSSMFIDAKVFNQPIGGWDTSRVENMYAMFSNTLAFNQDIGSWDMSNVTTTMSMFMGSRSFNQDLSDWELGNLENMTQMFLDAAAFTNGGNPEGLEQWDFQEDCQMTRTFDWCPLDPLPSWYSTP